MTEMSKIVLSERDESRLNRLRRAESDIRHSDNGTLTPHVLRECVQLWISVISGLGTSALAPGTAPERSEVAEAEARAPINRLDQTEVEATVYALASVDLKDPDNLLTLTQNSLSALESQLTSLTEPTNSGDGIQPRIFSEAENAWIDGRVEISIWHGRLKLLRESLQVMRLLDALGDRTQPMLESVALAEDDAKKAGAELERLRAELDQARAEKAQATLSAQFKALRTREHLTSWAFRLAALAVAGVAIAVAINVPAKADWPEVAAHLTIVAILGGASAYTARLASSHRAMGDWADSVRVQLNTFQDFLGVIDSADARTRVYEEFGRRVLGPPPAVNGEGTENGAMSTALLAQLASDIAIGRKRD